MKTKKKIVTIVGARPQFIKAAPLSKELKEFGFDEIIIHTGQHFDEDMSDIFFKQMTIPKPKYNLKINSLTHGSMTGRMLEEIEKILIIEKPSLIIVFGDTNSTLAGALAAAKLNIPIAHVESGLRSFNMTMPEEINRILTDRLSSFLFCPSEPAVNNLRKEGMGLLQNNIFETGDIMLDAVNMFKQYSKKPDFSLPDKFILATIHRAENTNDINKFLSIIKGLNKIDLIIPIVFPVHPRTIKIIKEHNIKSSINFLPPVGYFEMLYLLNNCEMVITDSGGLQKEAYFFNKKCLIIRDQTEWIELIELKYNILSPSNEKAIFKSFKSIYNQTMDFIPNIYGGGNTSFRICETIVNFLNVDEK